MNYRSLYFFIGFWLITFGIKPYYYAQLEDSMIVGERLEQFRWSGLKIAWLYFAFVCGAYFLTSKFRLRFKEADPQVVRVIWWFSLAVFLSLNLFLLWNGKITQYLSNRNITYSGNGFFKVFGSTNLLYSTVGLLYFASRSGIKEFRKKTLLVIVVGLLFLLVEMVRGKLVVLVVSIAILYHLFHKKISRITMLVFALVGFVIGGALSSVKYYLVTGRVSFDTESTVTGAMVSFDSFDHLVNVLRHDSYGYSHFLQPFVDPFLAVVPRQLWDEKPQAFGGVALQNIIYPQYEDLSGSISTYYSVSAPGEALMLLQNLWFIYPVIIGIILRIIDTNSRYSFFNFLLYVVVAANAFNIPRAGLFGLMSILVNIFIYYLFYKIIKICISGTSTTH